MGAIIKSNRNSNIELFRFILMMGICLWHTMVHGFGYINMGNMDDIPGSRLIIMALTIPAVDCFMMISGYYGIKLSTQKVFSFAFLGISAVLLCSIWVSQCTLIRYVCPISADVWWFFTAYFIVMLLSPFIEAGLKNLPKKQVVLILLYLLFINSIVKILDFMPGGRDILTLVSVYLLGRCLHFYGFSLSRSWSLVLFVASSLVLSVLVLVFYYYGNRNNAWLMLGNNNPLVILQSVSAFYFILSLKPFCSSLPNFLGKHSFSIYLITELIGMKIMYKQWAVVYDENIGMYALLVLSIALGCVVFDFVQSKISTYLYSVVPINQIANSAISIINRFVLRSI